MVKLRWTADGKRDAKPDAWGVRLKLLSNRIVHAVAKREPFSIGPHDVFGPAPPWQQRLQKRWREFHEESDFPTALGLLAFCLGITVVWKSFFPTFLSDLWPEMGGMVLDVFFILIIFAIFEQRRLRRTEINRQKEIIDDYKRWDAEEARLRIVGAIRRLNRMDVHTLDLTGAVLSNLSLARAGIYSIAKSVFYDGQWGVPQNETKVTLTKVAFDNINCSEVQFSPFDPFEALWTRSTRYARILDCTFTFAILRGALFNGAQLSWTEAPPTSLYAPVDEDDPEAGFMQVAFGPFHGADLTGASFRGARLENADFRGAEGVASIDFFRAAGVEDAFFDDLQMKAVALQSARREEGDASALG